MGQVFLDIQYYATVSRNYLGGREPDQPSTSSSFSETRVTFQMGCNERSNQYFARLGSALKQIIRLILGCKNFDPLHQYQFAYRRKGDISSKNAKKTRTNLQKLSQNLCQYSV